MLLIVVGLFFTGVPLFMDKVHSKSDLVEISATLRNCSFDEHRGPRYHTYLYYLYLNNYPNTFQISADFVPYFDKDYFEKTVQSGDTLHVFISRHDYAAIDYQEKVKLFGIYKDNTTYYLNCDQVIQKYNDGLQLYGGLIFIFVGLLLFYFNKDKLKISNYIL